MVDSNRINRACFTGATSTENMPTDITNDEKSPCAQFKYKWYRGYSGGQHRGFLETFSTSSTRLEREKCLRSTGAPSKRAKNCLCGYVFTRYRDTGLPASKCSCIERFLCFARLVSVQEVVLSCLQAIFQVCKFVRDCARVIRYLRALNRYSDGSGGNAGMLGSMGSLEVLIVLPGLAKILEHSGDILEECRWWRERSCQHSH